MNFYQNQNNPKCNFLLKFYYNLRYAKRIQVNILFLFCILFTEVLLLCLYKHQVNIINNKEIGKFKSITIDIANTTLAIENEMHNSLQNAVLGLSAVLEKKPNITFQELVYYRDQFKVDNIDIWDINGRMELDADGTHLPSDPTYAMYNRNVFSIFDRCSEYKNLTSLPNEPIVSLFNCSSKRQNVTQKFSIVYNDKIKKFVDVAYNTELDRNSITSVFQNYIKSHPDLLYIKLSSPIRDILFISRKDANDDALSSPQKYETNIHSEYKNKLFISRLSFGGIKPKSCILRTENDSNTDGDFFYTITTKFDGKNFKNEIFMIRILYLLIAIILPCFIVYIKDKISNGYLKLK